MIYIHNDYRPLLSHHTITIRILEGGEKKDPKPN